MPGFIDAPKKSFKQNYYKMKTFLNYFKTQSLPHQITMVAKTALVLALGFQLSACSTDLKMKVSGNLNQLSQNQTVAILPIEVVNDGQEETAALFRQSLYANLLQSDFQLMEHYVVDDLLSRKGLTDPQKFRSLNPMQWGEILGVDAVLISRMNRVEKSYMLVHSSIEISISAEMVDTRSGEILWTAEQTESDFEGIGKIPTGLAAAVIAPVLFVTSKLQINKLTSKMVDKLTAIIKHPEEAEEQKTHTEPIIASAWQQHTEPQFQEAVANGEDLLVEPMLASFPNNR
jgi:hypothetical protein